MYEEASSFFSSILGSGGEGASMPGSFEGGENSAKAIVVLLKLMNRTIERPILLALHPLGFLFLINLAVAFLLTVWQGMFLLGQSRTVIALYKRMNWTAQHIGLGFTLILLASIFYRRFKPKNRLKKPDDRKSIDNSVQGDSQIELDSPSRVKSVQESSLHSIRNKSRYNYPSLRKRRAQTTLKPLSFLISQSKTENLLKEAVLTETKDAYSPPLMSQAATISSITIEPSSPLENSIYVAPLELAVSLLDTADSPLAPTKEDAKDVVRNEIEAREDAENDHKDITADLVSQWDLMEDHKVEQPERLKGDADVDCKSIILNLQPSVQGNAPAAEMEVTQPLKTKDWSPRNKIIDIMKLLDFEDDDIKEDMHDIEVCENHGKKPDIIPIPPKTIDEDAADKAVKREYNANVVEDTDANCDEPYIADDVACENGESNVEESVDPFNVELVNQGEDVVVVDQQDEEVEEAEEVKKAEEVKEAEEAIVPQYEEVERKVTLEYQNMNFTEIPLVLLEHFTASLKTLNLSSNKLESLPSAFGLLTGLEFLYLRNNSLREIPSEFSSLESLQICDLADNRLSAIPDSAFTSERLQILDLSSNLLESLPTSIGNLRSLRTLILNDNNFTSNLLTDLIEPLIDAYAAGTTTKGFLFRLQGFLQDISDVQKEEMSTKRSTVITSARVPATCALSFHFFEGRDLVLSATLVNEKRQRIIQELLETEETYVNQLNDIYRLYMIPLSNFLAFSKPHYELLFSNLDDIRYLHKRIILPAFQAIDQDNISKSIGKLFLSICPILARYKDFLNNDNATLLLNKINGGLLQSDDEKRTSFLEWNPLPEFALNKFNKTQEAALEDSAHSQLNLAAYLLLPVQRLPRYKMLLDALLSATDQEHPDYEYLCQACDSISHLLYYLNESKKEFEKVQADLEKTLYRVRIPSSSQLNIQPLIDNTSLQTRKLVEEFDGLALLKYVTRFAEDSDSVFAPFNLSSKKSQVSVLEKASGVYEYKFKVARDSYPTQTIKQIETAGAISKFDIFGITGKKCRIIVTTDLLLITNSTGDLCGLFPLPLKNAASLIPLANAQHIPPQAVVRLNFGERLLFLRGSMDDLSRFGNATR